MKIQRFKCKKLKFSLFHWPDVLTCVYDDVLRQVSHINKRFVACLALVWTDIVMMPDVIGQLTGLHKPVQTETWDTDLTWFHAVIDFFLSLIYINYRWFMSQYKSHLRLCPHFTLGP